MTWFLLLACAGPADGPDHSADTVEDTDTDPDTDTGSPDDTAPIDADGDGFMTGDDCDDDNASVHPGADDVPYDGVDADCAGDDDDDADLDGHRATAAGGDDCDDVDPTSHPEALEWCDPVDHDCDGESLPAGVCNKVQNVAEMGRQYAYSSAAVRLLDDVTGDGMADIVLTNAWLPGTAIWAGGTPFPARPGTFPDSNQAIWYESSNMVHRPVEVGDVNGDGANDVGIVYTFAPVGVALFFGPVPTDGRTRDGTAPDAWWESYYSDTWGWGDDYAFADFDGDGINDGAVLVYDENRLSGGLHVFPGADFSGNHVQIGRSYDGTTGAWAAGDLDGDGLADLITGGAESTEGTSRFGWFSGADLFLADGAESIWDVAYASVTSTGYLYGHKWSRVPDWDGDDQDELVLSAGTNEADVSQLELLFFDASHRGALTLEDAIGGYAGGTEVPNVGWELEPCNAFGTPAFAARTDHDLVVFPVSSTIPARGTRVPDRRLYFEELARFSNCRDVTGDGIDDIAFHAGVPGAPDADDGLTIVPGWDLDWEDDALWVAP